METLNLPIREPKLWIVDVDGVLFVHNSHLEGEDKLIPEARAFLKALPASDIIMLVTARESRYRDVTEAALRKHDIRYDHLLFNMPKGERILINDDKPGEVQTAFAVRTERDAFPAIRVVRE